MTLLPRFRCVVAPNFHLDGDWTKRVSVGASVEYSAQGLVAHPPWRPASLDEMSVLDPARPATRDELSACLSLFVVPVHLRSAFWNLLSEAQERGEIPPDGFRDFAAVVASFLDFKQVQLPAGAAFDLVVHHQGHTAPLTASPAWGLINLGEDTAFVVILSEPACEGSAPDFPPVRIYLAPGEGVQVPAGMQVGSDGIERGHPDVLLLIRLPG